MKAIERRGKKRELQSRTIDTRKDVARRFQASVGNVALNRNSILSHLANLKNRGYAFNTVNLDFEILFKAYTDTAKDENEKAKRQAERKEARALFYVKENVQYHDKSISADEIQKLVSGSEKRMSLIIQTLAETGLRVSELCSLSLSQIHREKSTRDEVCFKILGKGKKTRLIFIDAPLVARVKKVFNGQSFLFQTVNGNPYSRNYISNKISELSGKLIEKNIHAHTLRHSWITLEIKAGTPIDAVSFAVGHASKAFTVNRYSHNTMTAGMRQTRFKGASI